MSLVAFGGSPVVPVGHANRYGIPELSGGSAILCDAAKEAAIMIGYVITEDGGSHTIDTTGSSSIGWLTAAVTFANAGTTVKVGVGAVDTASGPPGRAVNVADVITFDVSKSLTGGGGGITANAWQEHAPDTGSKTIANGDLVAVCVQMTARGGIDLVNVNCAQVIAGDPGLPVATSFTGGSYSGSRVPNVVIAFSDGTLGFLYGAQVFSVGTTTKTWNNSSSPNEYGNFIQLPFPAKAYGIIFGGNLSGDTDLVLYSDPLGTPSAQKTVSVDLNTVGNATISSYYSVLFPSPLSLSANTPYAVIAKPTSATNISVPYKTVNTNAHLKGETMGVNAYAINRASGAFAAQNSSKDLYTIGALLGAFDFGVNPSFTIGI